MKSVITLSFASLSKLQETIFEIFYTFLLYKHYRQVMANNSTKIDI
jgi:hypothetical protein